MFWIKDHTESTNNSYFLNEHRLNNVLMLLDRDEWKDINKPAALTSTHHNIVPEESESACSPACCGHITAEPSLWPLQGYFI